jgi:O-antigen ligase
MLFPVFLIFCAFLPFQFALNPTAGIDLAIVRVIIPLLFLAWLFWAIKNKQALFYKNKLSFLLLIFLALAVFSLFFSHNLAWSARKLLFLFSIFPLYFAAVSILNSESKKRLVVIVLTIGGSAIATIGILQFAAQFVFGIDPVYDFWATHVTPFFLGQSFSAAVLAYPSWLVSSSNATYMRAIAFFPDPHMFAYYLELLLPWSLALWATSQMQKKLFLCTSVVLALADICTFTRGSYVAIVISAIVILPFLPKEVWKKMAAGVAVFLLMIFLVPNNPVSSRFVSSFDLQEGSNQGRVNNWEQALNIIARNPWGVGIGNYSLAVNPTADYREPIYAHDLYLDIAAESGIISAFVFVAILVLSAKNFWLASRKNLFYLAGLASLLIFSVHSVFENPLYSVHILPLFLLLIALGTPAQKYAAISQN